jgi:cytochrome d ubiquinol oxidase subunit I
VASVGAYYVLRDRHRDFARASVKLGLALGLVVALLQPLTGDHSGKIVAQHQPAKLAAFEGHYQTGPAPLYVAGWVDEKSATTHGIAIPGMLSWLVYGDAAKPITGLNDIAPADRPPVGFVFQTYHAMIAIGSGLIALMALGAFYWWRGTLFDRRWYLWLVVFAVLGPQLANQFGWWSAEVGRQPWIVYGLLRTPAGLSQVLRAETVLTSLLLFTFIYLLLFVLFVYLLNDKIHHGPDDTDLTPTGKHALGAVGTKGGSA